MTGTGGRAERALACGGEFGPLDPLAERAHEHYLRGDSAAAVRAARAGMPVALALGDSLTARYLRYTAGYALHEMGQPADAVAEAHLLLADVDGGSEPFWRAKGLALLSEASAALGEVGQALDALAEGSWLLAGSSRDGYNRRSATMAVALAMRAVGLHEQADELLVALAGSDGPAVEMNVWWEAALLRAQWGASLGLLGRHDEARAHFVVCAQRSVRLAGLAREHADARMAERALVFESLALARLGEPGLAAARLAPVLRGGGLQVQTAEGQLARLVLGEAARHAGDLRVARDHLGTAETWARRTGHRVWAACAVAALADVDEAEHGPHPGVDRWRRLARESLVERWRDQEARFAALSARVRVRELLQQAVEMGEAVRRDPLTGLGNRSRLVEALDRAAHPLSVVFVDVDRFKDVNDSFSHEVGDEVLRQVAALLVGQCRADDVVVRYGGDEFVVVVADGMAAARAVAARVHAAVRDHPWDRAAPGLAVTVSVGVGTAGDGRSAVVAADSAVYAAKRAGRDRVFGEQPVAVGAGGAAP